MTSGNNNHIPIEIKLSKDKTLLTLSYESDYRCEMTAEFLRVNSPSAEVQGHHPSQAVLQTGKRLVKINNIEQVGHYAIKIFFDDGHDSGLYSWDYLYVIGKNQAQLWKDYLYALETSGSNR